MFKHIVFRRDENIYGWRISLHTTWFILPFPSLSCPLKEYLWMVYSEYKIFLHMFNGITANTRKHPQIFPWVLTNFHFRDLWNILKDACQEIFGHLVPSFLVLGILSLTLFCHIFLYKIHIYIHIYIYIINVFNISLWKNFQCTRKSKESWKEHS